MTEIIQGFFADLVNSTVDFFNSQMMATFESVLRVETLAEGSTVLSEDVVASVYQYIHAFAAALIVLKFLYKGFTIYILWRDGDADSSPQDMLVGSIQAIVTVIAFPMIYNIISKVTVEFTNTILSLIRLPGGGQTISGGGAGEALALIPIVGMTLANIVVVLIYLVLFAVLYVKLLQRGFELLILRLGIPFACMGLLDSDYGVWRSYIQVLFKTLFTSVIQLVTLSVSLTMVATGHIIIGIVLISVAFSAPLILQQVLVPTSRGGGVVNKIYTGSMTVRAIRGLMGG